MTKPTNHTEKCGHCHGTGLAFSDRKQGRQLKDEREALGVPQCHVARCLGHSSGYVSQLEKGVRRWTAALVKAYRKALTTKPKTKQTK